MFLDLYEVWAVTDDEHFVIGIFTDVNNWYYLWLWNCLYDVVIIAWLLVVLLSLFFVHFKCTQTYLITAVKFNLQCMMLQLDIK